MCGLLIHMKVFLIENVTKACIVVNDASVQSMLVNECANECKVCMWTKGVFREMFVVSMHCQWGSDIGPYLEYTDSIQVCKCNPCLDRGGYECGEHNLT